MSRVIGLGAGGHAKVVLDILAVTGEHEVIGLLDPDEQLWGSTVLGVEVLGSDDLLSGIGADAVFIGAGSGASTALRRRLYEHARRSGFAVVDAMHPAATVSASASIGPGATIMAGAIVNADARIGENTIVNSGAVVEHDCVIGDHVHIATGAHLAGSVVVGNGAHVGLSAAVNQGIEIGDDAIVGAGAVVIRNVPSGATVVGVPAHILRESAP